MSGGRSIDQVQRTLIHRCKPASGRGVRTGRDTEAWRIWKQLTIQACLAPATTRISRSTHSGTFRYSSRHGSEGV